LLRRSGLIACLLTEAHAAARLAWCLRHRYMTYEEWGLFLWSDECSVERGRGKNQEWCFRTPDQKWEREMIQTYDDCTSALILGKDGDLP
jgi:hypothetical protein